MKFYLTLSLLLLQYCFLTSSVNGQSWEVYYENGSFAQANLIIPYPGLDNGVQLTLAEPSNPSPSRIYSFDKTGEYLGWNSLPWTANWSIMNADKLGASYWVTHYQVRKLTADNQIAWTYSLPASAGSLRKMHAPNGGNCLEYITNNPTQNVIDYLNSNGQLVQSFPFPVGWPIDYAPGHDYSLIYTNDYPLQGTRHWVKVNQSNQIVWERDLDVDFQFYQGSLADGSTLAYNSFTEVLVKLDPSGNTQWEISLTSFFPGADYGTELLGMLVRQDGSVILCAGNYDQNFDDYFIKLINLDMTFGSAVWVRILASQQSSSAYLSGPMFEMPDGGILASFGLPWGIGLDNQILLVRTDPNGLTLTKQLSGKVYRDENLNCMPDANENGMKQITVFAQTATKKYSATSDVDGNFSMAISEGNFTLSITQPGSYWNYCDFQNPVTIDTDHDSVSVSIGAKATVICPELFVSIGSPVFRRCFDNNYLSVQYQNYGTAPAVDAYVSVTLDPKLIYLSATAPLLSQSGQTYKFDIGTVDIGESGSFTINFKVDCDATLGEILCVDSHIYPDTLCIPTAGAKVSNSFCLPVVASYDPNDKTAFVSGKPETAKILPDLGLEYLIRFQNTGNDTAFNIVIADTLGQRLDPTSVVPGASSHPYSFELRDGNVLRFVFNNILLPDSNTNEVASHGFVKFYIKQAPGNPIGSALSNTAAIFFDFNLPVITNESRLVVSTATGAKEPAANIEVKAWPVPARDRVDLLLPAGTPSVQSWKLMNLTGQVMRVGAAESSRFFIRRDGLPSGIYWCQVSLENGATALARIVFE